MHCIAIEVSTSTVDLLNSLRLPRKCNGNDDNTFQFANFNDTIHSIGSIRLIEKYINMGDLERKYAFIIQLPLH